MKRFAKTLFLIGMLSAATAVSAQSRNTEARLAASRAKADTVVLSQQCDGPYTVRHLLVRGTSPGTSRYDVHYAISRSDVERSMDNNAAQLDDIAGYVDPRTGDTLRHVECITVKGYASPDGPAGMNRTLAAARARKFAAYLDKNYGASQHYRVTVDSEVLPWTSCRAAVASSTMPDRSAVLAIIDSGMTDAEKQVRLKRMPAAWTYLARNVLPPLRRVDVAMDYDSDRLMTVRELTDPQPEVIFIGVDECVDRCDQCDRCDDGGRCGDACPCGCDPVDEEYDGIMIEYFGCPGE